MSTPILQVVAEVQLDQESAAHETATLARLIAGPGTGKSQVIQERVRWLLDQGVPAEKIYAVSFTRAAATDLRDRVHKYCAQPGMSPQIEVTTLHSLALRALKRAGLLEAYPTVPMVLDQWELDEIFDAEFGQACAVKKKQRRKDIRRAHEAYWSTGQWNPPNSSFKWPAARTENFEPAYSTTTTLIEHKPRGPMPLR